MPFTSTKQRMAVMAILSGMGFGTGFLIRRHRRRKGLDPNPWKTKRKSRSKTRKVVGAVGVAAETAGGIALDVISSI